MDTELITPEEINNAVKTGIERTKQVLKDTNYDGVDELIHNLEASFPNRNHELMPHGVVMHYSLCKHTLIEKLSNKHPIQTISLLTINIKDELKKLAGVEEAFQRVKDKMDGK